MRFERVVIDDDPPVTELDVCLPADLTGNGRDDVIVGAKDPVVVWYENADDGWERHRLAEGPVAAGESPHFPGTDPARVGYLDPPQWTPHVLKAGLFCPHSFDVADFDGDGVPDVYVGRWASGNTTTPATSCSGTGATGRSRPTASPRAFPPTRRRPRT